MTAYAWKRRHASASVALSRIGELGSRPAALFLGPALIILLLSGFLLSPVELPRALSTFGLLALFIAVVAIISSQLTLIAVAYRVPVIALLLIAALGFSLLNLNDNHRIRTLPESARPIPSSVEAFAEWYVSRPDLQRFKDDYPVYIVAAQGGGIYAAYQPAIFMARLQDRCPLFRHHLFAISSVSGGSVGAVLFQSLLRDQQRIAKAFNGQDAADHDCRHLSDARLGPGPLEQKAGAALSEDHLSPLIAATLFPDFTQRFLPVPVPAFDRARALEQSFEQAAAAAAGADILSQPFLSHWASDTSLPALVINTTDAASGLRYVIAPFEVGTGLQGRSPGLRNYPYSQGAPDMRLSTAAVISARFPWLTPAALVSQKDGDVRLVDGGYVDNSGIETALDLIEELGSASVRRHFEERFRSRAMPFKPPRFILIAITGGGVPQRTSYAMGETMEPIRALLSTRVTRSYVALDRAYRVLPARDLGTVAGSSRLPVRLSDVRRVDLSNQFYDLPLGWRLSADTRRIIEAQSGRAWDCEPNRYLEQAAPKLSTSDCVHNFLGIELKDGLENAAVVVAALNFRTSSQFSRGIRFDHNDVLKCYVRTAGKQLTYRQAMTARRLMEVWDAHPQLTNDSWLAYGLGTLHHETAGFSVFSEPGSPELLEQRYGPASPWGRRLGNVVPGDGWKYRGRGFLMITGRSNYRSYSRAAGVDLESWPDLLLNPAVSAAVAHDFLFRANGERLGRYLDRAEPDWTGARRIVAGGLIQASQVAREAERFDTCIKDAKAVRRPAS